MANDIEPYPHHYTVHAVADTESNVALAAEGLPTLSTAPPPQYGGPEGHWAPETLFVAAIADCFILTFRAVARASNLPWREIECRAEGVVDRREHQTQFTDIRLHARLTLPNGGDPERAERLLEKAKKACLVTNSLKREPTLTTQVSFTP